MHILKVKIFNYILEDILISETHLLYQNKSCIIGNEKVIAVSFNFFPRCLLTFFWKNTYLISGGEKETDFYFIPLFSS